MKQLTKILIILISFTSLVFSQLDTNELKHRYGGFARYGSSINLAGFSKLPNTPSCCPEYTTSIGTSIHVGGLMDYVVDYNWGLNFRAYLELINTDFESMENTMVSVNGVETIGQFTHYLNTNFTNIAFDLNAYFLPETNLTVYGGLSLSLITKSDFSQYEQITKPSDIGIFVEEGTRIRNPFDGEIQDVSNFQLGLNIGASYRFPLNKTNSLF
ncbi:outer membrane beta-barrel protein, partial [Candidatus Kapabacteria bacterium]|nr:outer membrane beta-barrel protein [Candidatus Kapabacteria bacterium]